MQNIKFYFWKPEDNPKLFMKLKQEIERINNSNPDLIKINNNTWIKKKK
jgi:hypothetical protein